MRANLNFIDESFDGFVNRIVKPADQKEFNTYYSHFIEVQRSQSAVKRNKALEKIRSLAHASLEVKHPEWALALEPFEKKTIAQNPMIAADQKKVHKFLVRYGVHEEFLKQKGQWHNQIWSRTKNYAQGMSEKVTRLVNYFKRSKKI